jgi:hypothetical protein
LQGRPEGASSENSMLGNPRKHHNPTATDHSDVHITIGNEIGERLLNTDNVQSTLSFAGTEPAPGRWRECTAVHRMRRQHLDSCEDTFGLVLPGQSGPLESSTIKDSSGDSMHAAKATGAAVPGQTNSSSNVAAAVDGMFHTSMDSAAVATLPVLEQAFEPPLLASVRAVHSSHASPSNTGSPHLPSVPDVQDNSVLRGLQFHPQSSASSPLQRSPFDSTSLPAANGIHPQGDGMLIPRSLADETLALANTLQAKATTPLQAVAAGLPAAHGIHPHGDVMRRLQVLTDETLALPNTLQAKATTPLQVVAAGRTSSGSLRRPPRQPSRTQSGPGSRVMTSPFDDGPANSRQLSRQPSNASEAVPALLVPAQVARTTSAFDMEPPSVRQSSNGGQARPAFPLPPTRQLAESVSMNSSAQRLSDLGTSGEVVNARVVHAASYPGFIGCSGYMASPVGIHPTGHASLVDIACTQSSAAGNAIRPSLLQGTDSGVLPPHDAAAMLSAAQLSSTFDVEPASTASTTEGGLPPWLPRTMHLSLSTASPLATSARPSVSHLKSTFDTEPPSARSSVHHFQCGPRMPNHSSAFSTEPAASCASGVVPSQASGRNTPRVTSASDVFPKGRATTSQPSACAHSVPRLASSFDMEPPTARTASSAPRSSAPGMLHLTPTFDSEPSASRMTAWPPSGVSGFIACHLTSNFDKEPSAAQSGRLPPPRAPAPAAVQHVPPLPLADLSLDGGGHHISGALPSLPNARRLHSTFDLEPSAARRTAAAVATAAAAGSEPKDQRQRLTSVDCEPEYRGVARHQVVSPLLVQSHLAATGTVGMEDRIAEVVHGVLKDQTQMPRPQVLLQLHSGDGGCQSSWPSSRVCLMAS